MLVLALRRGPWLTGRACCGCCSSRPDGMRPVDARENDSLPPLLALRRRGISGSPCDTLLGRRTGEGDGGAGVERLCVGSGQGTTCATPEPPGLPAPQHTTSVRPASSAAIPTTESPPGSGSDAHRGSAQCGRESTRTSAVWRVPTMSFPFRTQRGRGAWPTPAVPSACKATSVADAVSHRYGMTL